MMTRRSVAMVVLFSGVSVFDSVCLSGRVSVNRITHEPLEISPNFHGILLVSKGWPSSKMATVGCAMVIWSFCSTFLQLQVCLIKFGSHGMFVLVCLSTHLNEFERVYTESRCLASRFHQ